MNCDSTSGLIWYFIYYFIYFAVLLLRYFVVLMVGYEKRRQFDWWWKRWPHLLLQLFHLLLLPFLSSLQEELPFLLPRLSNFVYPPPSVCILFTFPFLFCISFLQFCDFLFSGDDARDSDSNQNNLPILSDRCLSLSPLSKVRRFPFPKFELQFISATDLSQIQKGHLHSL